MVMVLALSMACNVQCEGECLEGGENNYIPPVPNDTTICNLICNVNT